MKWLQSASGVVDIFLKLAESAVDLTAIRHFVLS